jgi:hypothetical protein
MFAIKSFVICSSSKIERTSCDAILNKKEEIINFLQTRFSPYIYYQKPSIRSLKG